MTNLQAFLTTIAISEGTEPFGDHGYDCIVGSRPDHAILFTNYTNHPHVKVQLGPQLWSTAAGRYQILARYFDSYKDSLRLPDFSPLSQDAIAIQMIHEQQAFDDVVAGRFDVAIGKCANIWASFPGAGYNQYEQRLANLRTAFTGAGGMLV